MTVKDAFSAVYQSPIGALRVHGSRGKISRIHPTVGRVGAGKLPSNVRQWLDAYFRGRPHNKARFSTRGTPFQKRVWKALEGIPWGESVSYKELARRVKRSRAVRAVAGAVGRNPVAILVPCHRVIGSDGTLTGYAYGLKKKAWLLQHEKRQKRG